MDHQRKNGSPYAGIWAGIIILLIVPWSMYALFDNRFAVWLTRFSPEFNNASARIVGFGLGAMFHIFCMFSGAFKPTWQAVGTRMRNFKENLSVSFRYAVKEYGKDMKSDGVVFLIYSLVMLSNVILLGIAVYDFSVLLRTM